MKIIYYEATKEKINNESDSTEIEGLTERSAMAYGLHSIDGLVLRQYPR